MAEQISDAQKMLDLEANVICESNREKLIRMCQGCVRRERKRAERRKNAKLTSVHIQPGSSIVDEAYEYDRKRILLFSSDPVIDFSSFEATLPTRITCYCRHHDERIGFRVCFSIKDYKGCIIATGLSPPIMITDDHKLSKTDIQRRQEYPSSEDDCRTTPGTSRRNSMISSHITAQSPTTNLTLATYSDPWQTMIIDSPKTNSPLSTSLLEKDFSSLPYIKQVLPSHGTISGGTRVMILGHGFDSDTIVVFGHLPAIIASVSSTFIICFAPPVEHQGTVQISIDNHIHVLFDYYDDCQKSLYDLSQSITGGTPVHITNIVQILSQYHHQTDFFHTSPSGQTLLHLAAHLNMYPLAHWLITNYTALIHIQDRNGLSPLHFALRSRSTHIIHELINYGTNPCLSSCLGTPIDLVVSLFETQYPQTRLIPSIIDSYLPWLPKSFVSFFTLHYPIIPDHNTDISFGIIY